MKTKSNPISRNVVLPLIFGLTAMGTAPIVGATVVTPVNIVDGGVDVNGNGLQQAVDDLNNVFLWCQGAAPVRVDIIDGFVDVNENGVITNNDSITNCDLTDETGIHGAVGFPRGDRVNIVGGLIDVDQDGIVPEFTDDLTNVQLYRD
ncbi:MAG: hypothetical protein ABL933_11630 [Methyloglobulus sp.]|nr:hypothetical protein [Methyloglobulus sp.]